MRYLMFALTLSATLALGLNEAALPDEYNVRVVPFLAQAESGTFVGVDQIVIQYRIFRREAARGAVLFVLGYAETFSKYAELYYDLWSNGYSVYVMDHRGMGLSGRLLENSQIIHVQRFSDYVDDLEKFVDTVVANDSSGRRYLVSHSTGGLMAAKLLVRRPAFFRAALLSAPLFELNTGNYPRSIVHVLSRNAVRAGRGAQYATGYSDFNLAANLFETNNGTQSRARFDWYHAVLTSTPAVRMGGPSFQWIKIVLDETEAAKVIELAEAVRTPVLLYQLGRDTYVRPNGQNLFCTRARGCRKVVFAGSRHEILRETDEFRAPALAQMFEFFNAH